MTTNQRVDVIVVGAGIVGCSAAYYLAKQGLGVTLVEKGEIAGEQSSRNWGFVRQQGRDPSELPLMIECNRMWQGLEAELGQDLGWRQAGNLAIAASDQRMASFESWLETVRQYPLRSRLVGKREIESLVPGISIKWPGGLFTPNDGQAEPHKVAAAYSRAAAARGTRIYTGCAVKRIDVAGGRVTGVQTERGDLRASTVVVAAGAWSSKLLRSIGLSLPQLLIRASVARTSPVPDITAIGVWTPDVAFRQRRDGSLNIASGFGADFDITLDVLRHWRMFLPSYRANRKYISLHCGMHLLRDAHAQLMEHRVEGWQFQRVRVLNPKPSSRKIAAAVAGMRRILPGLTSLRVHQSWAGAIDMTPDALPVLDTPAPGLVTATGFSGHGFGMGPIAGRLVAELISQGVTSLDIGPFSLARFDRPPKLSDAVL